MINLKIKNIPKIGFVVTLFVLTTACAHQSVAPANNDASAVIEPTPAPLSDVEGWNDVKPEATKRKGHSKGKKKSHKSASAHKVLKKKSSIAHKAPAESSSSVAALGSVSNDAQPPAPPMPSPELTAEHSAMIGSVRDESAPMFQSLWEQAEDYLLYALMALGTVGIVLVASRLERKRVKGRRKIVFN